MSLPFDVVADACRAWIWYPESATTVETPEYLLVRFPDWFEVDLELLRLDPVRPLAEVVDEVIDRAREMGAPEVSCWVKLGADPALDDLLIARGGALDETLAVLALDMTPGLPDLGDLDPSFEVRWETDMASSRDNHQVGVDVFGGSMAPDDEVAAAAERGRADVAEGRGGSVVVYGDGVPLGSGGLSLVDGVARLWGGAVREQARGRGVYRAVLDARLRYALDRGATMALVKGRVQTSGPILSRAGFERFGEERSYLVPLA